MLGTSRDLSALLGRVAAGDREAFTALYEHTSAKVYGVIVRIVNNRSSADEVMQEVFVKVWQRAGEFDSQRASPITWMATIARNRAIDEIRRAKPLRIVETPEPIDIAADLDHPLDSAERSETLQALIACLNRLGEERREIILLAYYRGLSREDLAQRFGRPVPTIKTWLHRGLAQLKTCLSA